MSPLITEKVAKEYLKNCFRRKLEPKTRMCGEKNKQVIDDEEVTNKGLGAQRHRK